MCISIDEYSSATDYNNFYVENPNVSSPLLSLNFASSALVCEQYFYCMEVAAHVFPHQTVITCSINNCILKFLLNIQIFT